MRPYSPPSGRGLTSTREGCYKLSQPDISAVRDEVERTVTTAVAAESMYDHPCQWVRSALARSARVAALLRRMARPASAERAQCALTIMPGYAVLAERDLDQATARPLRALYRVGVPIPTRRIEAANED